MGGFAIDASAGAIVEALELRPNPLGGWFRQVHEVASPSGAGRSLVTVINYLLEETRPVTFFHRMSADAVHFFHQGCPVKVLTIDDEGTLEFAILGADPGAGHDLQVVVAGGRWKAFELQGGPWALLSEAVSPGWEAADQEEATVAMYERDFPHLRGAVERFVP
jgi:uncharacterized protein